MEPSNNDQLLKEIYRLTHENNQLLHRARRSAFFWGFVKFLMYALLLLAPIWFYVTYLNGTVQQLLQAANKVEGANTQAQTQLQSFESGFQQLESRFGGSTTTTQ
jgi:hypothetical protein